LAPCVRIELT